MVRQTNRYWEDLSTVLAIEQVLMRSIKTCGCLTRSRGMTEIQITVLLLSTPACAEINRGLQEFKRISYSSRDQHVESKETSLSSDHKDIMLLLQFLKARGLF